MKINSSAIARCGIAIRQVWDELVRAEALRLHRPWEAEGELRWVRDVSGPQLVGQELPAGQVSRRHERRAQRPRVLRG